MIAPSNAGESAVSLEEPAQEQQLSVTNLKKFGLILLSSLLASCAMLCISASKVHGTEQYIFVTVTFCGEVCKLALVSGAYFVWVSAKSEQNYIQLADEASVVATDRLLYAVPAFLYMLDNNLAFVILQYIDPGTLNSQLQNLS